MAQIPITIYGAPWCAPCVTLKRYLDAVGIKYEYRNVEDRALEKDMLAKTNGRYLLPAVIIGETVLHNPTAPKVKELAHARNQKI